MTIHHPPCGSAFTIPAFDLDQDEREAIETWHDQTRLSRHTNGRRSRIARRFRTDPATVIASAARKGPTLGEEVIALSRRVPEALVLGDALIGRHSTRRDHIAGKITVDQAGALLALAAATTRVKKHDKVDCSFESRSYPSAGGLLPCTIYVCANTPGLGVHPYRYDAGLHALVDYGCQDGDFRRMELGNAWPAAPLAIVITADMQRVMPKYGPRGYRFAVLEAGHIGQNLLLAATALGLTSLVYGSYYDRELEQWLGLDGLNEVVLSVVLVGEGGGAPQLNDANLEGRPL